MSDDRPEITGNLKVGALLAAYPELESVLVDLAPPFRRLRNPVLRRTVAQVTTLSQAARVAGVPVGQLIQTLRQAAGQTATPAAQATGPPSTEPVPDWVRRGVPAAVVNADEVLATGDHPLTLVREHLRSLAADQVLIIEGSFRPEPLTDLLRGQGYAIHVQESGPASFRTFVGRQPQFGP